MRPALIVMAALVGMAGCANEYHPEYHPVSEYSYAQNISYPTTVIQNGGSSGSQFPAGVSAPRADNSRILVLQTTHLDRPAEVIGVIDAHQNMNQHESALEVLRSRAAALGADAVVGVEFHHGEGQGEPTHLSGLAVRFL